MAAPLIVAGIAARAVAKKVATETTKTAAAKKLADSLKKSGLLFDPDEFCRSLISNNNGNTFTLFFLFLFFYSLFAYFFINTFIRY